MSTGIRSNKENILAFQTPHVKNDGAKLNPRTPVTVGRIPFGGKNTNVRQSITTIDQKKHSQVINIDTQTSIKEAHSQRSKKSSKIATPLFDVPADEIAEPISDELSDIEYTPRLEIDKFKNDDDLDLDLDFDFIRKALRNGPKTHFTDELDHELTFDVEIRENPAKKYLTRAKKPISNKQASKNSFSISSTENSALPNFMAPTKSALSKRSHKSMTTVYRDPELEISSDDILGNLGDQIY